MLMGGHVMDGLFPYEGQWLSECITTADMLQPFPNQSYMICIIA
jgi:hypothetical protein